MNAGNPTDLSLATAIVAALALAGWLGVLWWQRKSAAGRDDVIRLLALRPMGGKRLIAVIEVEQERFLLGLTDENISCLGRMATTSSSPANGLTAAPPGAPAPSTHRIAVGGVG